VLGVGLELGFELSSARDGFGGRHAVERDGGEVGEELASADDAAGHVVGYTGFIGSLALGVGDVGDGALGAGFGKVFELVRLCASDFEHFFGEPRELGAVNPERLIARPRLDLVQHGELSALLVDERLDVKVGDATRAFERGELVKVSGKQTRRLNLIDDVLAYRPRETESVVCTRSAAEFIDDNETR